MAYFRGTFPIVIASNRRSLCCHTTGKIVVAIKMFYSWMIGVCCYLEMVFMLIKYAGMYDIVYVCWRHGNLMAMSWDEYRIGVLMNKGSICTISLFTIFSTPINNSNSYSKITSQTIWVNLQNLPQDIIIWFLDS